MSRDLEYFAEFLADPAKYEFDEFHRLAKEWARYIKDHENEFNYLEDDDWKEIRERLLDVFYAREHEMDEVEDEWDEIGEMIENSHQLSDQEKIKLYERQIQFMKNYRSYFNFTEDSIKELSRRLGNFVRSSRQVELLKLRTALKQADYDKLIAELDDGLFDYLEGTGKTPRITAHQPIKKHRGN